MDLVFLQIAVVCEWQALLQREQCGERSDGPRRPSPSQFRYVGVLLLWQGGGSRREGIGEGDPSELRSRPEDQFLGQAREVDHRLGAAEAVFGSEVAGSYRIQRVREVCLPSDRLGAPGRV